MSMKPIDIDLNRKIGFLWPPVARQQTFPTPRKNREHYLAGALDARTERVDYVEGSRKNTDFFLKLLEHPERSYSTPENRPHHR